MVNFIYYKQPIQNVTMESGFRLCYQFVRKFQLYGCGKKQSYFCMKCSSKTFSAISINSLRIYSSCVLELEVFSTTLHFLFLYERTKKGLIKTALENVEQICRVSQRHSGRLMSSIDFSQGRISLLTIITCSWITWRSSFEGRQKLWHHSNLNK